MGAGILIGPLSFLLFSLMMISSTLAAGAGGGGAAVAALWCVAKNNAEDAALQSALDWACGPGGAGCGPIQNGGPCYDGSDLQRTASYAFNEYYIKHGPSEENCYFDNTAALTSLNPGHDKCIFPSSSLNSGNGNFSGAGSSDVSSSTSLVGSHWDLDWGLLAIFAILLNL